MARFIQTYTPMATIEEMKLPSFLVHRDNRPPPPVGTDQRLDGVDNDTRKGWIVKLEFLRGNTRKSGGGPRDRLTEDA